MVTWLPGKTLRSRSQLFWTWSFHFKVLSACIQNNRRTSLPHEFPVDVDFGPPATSVEIEMVPVRDPVLAAEPQSRLLSEVV